MNLKNLENCYKESKKLNYKYVGVKIKMYGFKKPEIIINSSENFDKKLAYYKNAYTDDLKLKNAPDKIEIAGFTYGDSFEDIEKDLIG